MSRGWNFSDHVAEVKAAEREMIKAAIARGVKPRCEINAPEDARYYMDLGVKHFCIGDELKNAGDCWTAQGKGLRALLG
jgi:2-keto-3-deoxy-L-rhamnonate aldolase RhmA